MTSQDKKRTDYQPHGIDETIYQTPRIADSDATVFEVGPDSGFGFGRTEMMSSSEAERIQTKQRGEHPLEAIVNSEKPGPDPRRTEMMEAGMDQQIMDEQRRAMKPEELEPLNFDEDDEKRNNNEDTLISARDAILPRTPPRSSIEVIGDNLESAGRFNPDGSLYHEHDDEYDKPEPSTLRYRKRLFAKRVQPAPIGKSEPFYRTLARRLVNKARELGPPTKLQVAIFSGLLGMVGSCYSGIKIDQYVESKVAEQDLLSTADLDGNGEITFDELSKSQYWKRVFYLGYNRNPSKPLEFNIESGVLPRTEETDSGYIITLTPRQAYMLVGGMPNKDFKNTIEKSE